MKQNRPTLFVLLCIFIVMVAILTMQSTQQETLEIPPTNATLRDNDVELGSGLLFPNVNANDVVMVNILDPVLDSQVTIARSLDDTWQVVAEESYPANQEYANSVAVTLEKIPFTTQISVTGDSESFGLNEQDALIVISAILRDETLHTFVVGNPVSTDDTTRGFYTAVDERDKIYIVPPEPILYLVQYLEAFENTQKLDN